SYVRFSTNARVHRATRDGAREGRMTGDYGMGGGWFGMGFGWILIVALVVAAGIFVFRQTGGDRAAGGRESARDILDKRYARGEIGDDEYEKKKHDLVQ
ncbi:MAG: SHOCT domain-containing protein, partial [Acidobacteriota bacterium]|nr:SHOCT domain-containing protein [Acidobacteriota bacterium]